MAVDQGRPDGCRRGLTWAGRPGRATRSGRVRADGAGVPYPLVRRPSEACRRVPCSVGGLSVRAARLGGWVLAMSTLPEQGGCHRVFRIPEPTVGRSPAAVRRGPNRPGHRGQRRHRLLRRGTAGRHRRRGGARQPGRREGRRGHGLDPCTRLRSARTAPSTGPGRPVVPEDGRGRAGPRSSRRGGPQRGGRARRPAASGDRGRPRADVRHQPPRPFRSHAAAGPPAVRGAGGPRRDGGKLRGALRATGPGRSAVDPGLPAGAHLRPVETGADVLRLRTRPSTASRRQHGAQRGGPPRRRAGLAHPVPPAGTCDRPRRAAARPARRAPGAGQGRRSMARRPCRPRPGGAGRAAVGAEGLRTAWHTTE